MNYERCFHVCSRRDISSIFQHVVHSYNKISKSHSVNVNCWLLHSKTCLSKTKTTQHVVTYSSPIGPHQQTTMDKYQFHRSRGGRWTEKFFWQWMHHFEHVIVCHFNRGSESRVRGVVTYSRYIKDRVSMVPSPKPRPRRRLEGSKTKTETKTCK